MPTGAGKTLTASTVVHGAASKRNPTWWLCHRRELVAQASQTFYSLGIPHGVVQAGHVSDPHALVQVGSIQTVTRRTDALPEPALIVFDESHHIGAASWDALFQRFPRAKILGLTATPWRLDGQGLGRWYSSMIEGPATAELIAEGSLSAYRLFAPAVPDLSEVGTTAGDYQRGALAKAMDKPQIVGDAIGHYSRLCPGKRAVVFAAGVENSRHIVEQFRAAGIPAEHVDGGMGNDERDAKVDRFRRGETLILSNSDLFGEGFDVPAIEAAILLRPTKSLSLYLQQVGRSLRPFPGKAEAIILDHAGNSLTHGLPDDPREWSLEDRERRRRAAPAEVPVRQCRSCFFVYRPAPRCPQCGHAAPVQAREIEQVDGTLAEVRRDEQQAKRQRWLEERDCHSLSDWQALARQRGYKPGWALIRWQARQRRAA
jgi:superfamily II DNA or RNA helicase